MWVDASGALAGSGGRRITVGVTADGAVYLGGDADGEGMALGADAAEHLGAMFRAASATARRVPAAELAAVGRIVIGVTAEGAVHVGGEYAGRPVGAALAERLGELLASHAAEARAATR